MIHRNKQTIPCDYDSFTDRPISTRRQPDDGELGPGSVDRGRTPEFAPDHRLQTSVQRTTRRFGTRLADDRRGHSPDTAHVRSDASTGR